MISSQQYRVADSIVENFFDAKTFYKQDEIIIASAKDQLVITVMTDIVRFAMGGITIELDASDWDNRTDKDKGLPIGSLKLSDWFGKLKFVPFFPSRLFEKVVSACVNALCIIEEEGIAVRVLVGDLLSDTPLVLTDGAIVRA